MQQFTKLVVWRRGHALLLRLDQELRHFPSHELYGLTSQLRRAALSVTNNIAEGSKRASNVEYAHFLNIAQGSLAEVENCLLVARDLNYLPHHAAKSLLIECNEIGQMLTRLRTAVLRAIKTRLPSANG